MAGRINDVTTDVMSYAINTMKEAKEKKAQAAFFSVLDSAVKADQGSEKKVSGESVTDSKDKELVANGKVSGKETTDQTAKDNNTPVKDTKQTKESSSKVQDDTSGTDKTDMEEAEEVVDAICEELGLTKEQLFQQFEQFADAIAALLMEQFGVTKQEIDVVLETLGLEVTDLLDTKNLMEAVVMLTGAEDISAVLTDENLYAQIQEVKGDMEALLQEGMADTPVRAETLQKLEKSIQVLNVNADVQEAPKVENVSQKIQPQKRADIQTADTSDENLLPVMEIETDKPEEHTKQESGQQHLSGQEAFTQFTSRLAEHVVRADGEMPAATFAQTEQMEAIMRQVTDNVRLQVQADTTSLEMQLHPESYGKLNLHVSVREGVVTAQLAVENEMVRQALETQVVQLREEMQERGLVVDAVEVTIASHEFERNLEQDQQTGEGQQADEGARRNIDLNNENLSLEEIMEMSEAESLARRMMLENGNTVDYSA